MLPEIRRFQHWLRRKYPNTSTAIHYLSDLKLFFAQVPKPIFEIGIKDIDAFIERCLKKGHAVATVNRRLASIRCLYWFLAVESSDAPKNPVVPKRHFIRQGRRLPRDAKDEEVFQLFSVIDHLRDRAMFLLMLRCGLRVGEVRNLSMCDLYLQPTMGMLPRLRLNGKGYVHRTAYLSSQAYSALVGWLAVRPVGESQAVFLNKYGGRLTITGIQDRLAKFCRLAGVWITCHQLRHTFGRHMTEARVPVTTIQRLMGHARLRTTEVYLHISDAQVQADYEAAMIEVMSRLPQGGAS